MRPKILTTRLKPPDFDEIEDDFTSPLDSFFSGQRPLFSLSDKIWTPPTDVYEVGPKLLIKMEIAGVREEDLEIAVDRNLLRVSGARREDLPPEPRATFHLMEIRYGSFERIFGLPSKLDFDAIAATYRDGFLIIEVPRPDREPREITIEVD
jgi:HSP20 family protein